MVLKLLPCQSTQGLSICLKIEYAKPRGDGGSGRQRRAKRHRAQEGAKGKDDEDDERKRKEFRLDSMCR